MNIKRLKLSILVILILFSIPACIAWDPTGNESSALKVTEPLPLYLTATANPDLNENTIRVESSFIGLTYQQADGNRQAKGRGSIMGNDPISIDLTGEIKWLVGIPFDDGVLWTAALVDGNIDSYIIQNGQVQKFDIGRGPLPAGMPPMILDHQGEVYLNTPLSPETSQLSHPVSPNPDSGRFVFITDTGDLILWDQGEMISRLEVNALVDARLIQDEMGRLLFLSDPTDRYGHGVLGDGLEAGSITLVETLPSLKVVNKIEISSPAVIEGIAPIWSDLNGDGKREILVTVSDLQAGAKLVLFDEDGELLAEGPAAGQGYRWRHQLAAAPMGPSGEILIIDVLRPHLDATLEFFSWQGDQLVLKADLAGFSTHSIGSRNLDMALVGDLDGDGAYEVVAPDTSRESLNGIGFVEGKTELLWTIPLGDKLTSNLAGVELNDGSLSLGAGVGNRLLVWE